MDIPMTTVAVMCDGQDVQGVRAVDLAASNATTLVLIGEPEEYVVRATQGVRRWTVSLVVPKEWAANFFQDVFVILYAADATAEWKM